MSRLTRVVATSLLLAPSACGQDSSLEIEARDPFALNTAMVKEIEDRDYDWSSDYIEGFAVGAASRCIDLARERHYAIGDQYLEEDISVEDREDYSSGIENSAAVGESLIVHLCSEALERIKHTV